MAVMMEPQNNTHLAKSLLIIIAVFISGSVIGMVADPYLPSAISNAKKGYDTGFAAARKVVEESTLGNFFKTPDDVRTLSGTVTSIDGNRISLHLASNNPFDDASLADRTVLITADTKIVKNVAKDPKTLSEELARYRALTKTSTSGVPQPQPYDKVVSDFSVIKAGDSISVSASENIKMMEEFSASEIQIDLKLVMPR